MPAGAGQDLEGSASLCIVVLRVGALAARPSLGAVTSPAVIKFLSTLSLRRATAGRGHVARRHEISIHALLAESD